jgi:hypothetical protein
MKKITFCFVLMLAMFQVSRIVVWAQAQASTPTPGILEGARRTPDKPATPVSGICGIALVRGWPLDEYQKGSAWKTSFSIRVYPLDDIYHREAVDTQDIQPTGYFRLNLPPGKYKLVPLSAWTVQPSPHPLPPQAKWQTVVVEETKFTVVTVDYGRRR